MTDLHRYLVTECLEDFAQGRVSRREALKVLAGLTGTVLAATRLLDAHAQTAPPAAAPAAPAKAQEAVAPDDPAVSASRVTFRGRDAELTGYLARPSTAARAPIVLVCHENRGLTPHIEDVARRVAKAGYVALAVDLLSREGGSDKVGFEGAPAALGKPPALRHVQDFQSGLAYARMQSYAAPDRAGMVGFCFGGGVTWQVAVDVPDLRAAVPYYGAPASASDVPRINAAVLAIYAGNDQRINAMIPAVEEAMQKNNKTFRKIVYPDVEHAFNNDTGSRFNQAAATAAWRETLAWFQKYLA